jgi:predicted DNA binding CopG/RHH family protein
MDKKELDELSADHERWDNRELGASAEHIAFLSDAEEREMDDSMGLQLISIRLGKSLIESLKALARLEGLGYQPLVRQVLTRYAKENEYKLDVLLSAAEAAERADNLFMHANKLKSGLLKLTPLSNERIHAETEYTRTLSKSRTLFAEALDTSDDPILRQHANLRIHQIGELCREDAQAARTKKRPKKRRAV